MSEADTAEPAAPARRPGPLRLGYQPALDGIRGVGLVAVLVFHAGITWLPGSFLAVSAFFTLSGFLITRLLVEERAGTGATDLGRFYARRVRRLVPASSLTLLLVVALGWLGAFEGVADLRRELVGAALQASNWVRLTSSTSYVDLFQDGVSPVEHYWSLAIEEQFYLLWPLLFLAVARRSRALTRKVVVGAYLVFAAAAPVLAWAWGPEAAYLATPARIAEILAGAALAMVFDWRSPPWWLARVSVLAGVAIVALMVLTPFDHGWAYEGGLPAYALLSATVVAGALVDGPLRRFLSAPVLVRLGTLSYVVYLVHWPTYVLVEAHGDDLGSAGRLVAKFAVTFAVAWVIHVAVERPIHTGPIRRGTIPLWLAMLAVVGVLAAAVLPGEVTIGRPRSAADSAAVDLEPVSERLAPLLADGERQRPVRVMLVGDSTGTILANGFVGWALDRPDEVRFHDSSMLGCGLLVGGRSDDLVDLNRPDCDEALRTTIPNELRTLRPDVVVVSIAGADSFPRTWDDEGALLRPTDADYARHIAEDYAAFVDDVASAGIAHLVWLRPPVYGDPPDASFADGGQALLEDAIRAGAERHPGLVSILDYRSWFEAEGFADRPELRPDGVHLRQDAADDVVSRWLGPAVVDLALDA